MRHLTQDDMCRLLDGHLLRSISTVADALHMECYLVGGYVRDLFLERPTNDIDVVVVGSGIAMAEAFAKHMGRGAHLAVFRNFGTAQVKWQGQEVEFVGARRESYHRESRKPIVEDGTLADDQNRRDFTINAMAVCLNGVRYGELVDPFCGLYDLEDGIIRTPLDPDITFSDDPLRMMRCVRFATQLRFQIEPETFEALERNKERIRIISAERIIDELNKIMAAQHPSIGLYELHRSGLLAIILPEVAALDVVEQRAGRKHKNNFDHTLEVLENVCRDSDNLWLRWAALLHDIGKPRSKGWDAVQGWTFHNHNYLGMRMIKPLFRRMKLPLDERMRYVERLVELHMRPIAIADDEVTDSAVRRLLFEAGDDIDDLMLLCEADITSKNQQRKQRFLDNFQLVRKKLVDIEEKDRIRNFQPPVDGEEIMRLYGLPPCQIVGSLKAALKDAILDGEVPNEHDAALRFLMARAEKMGLTLAQPPKETSKSSTTMQIQDFSFAGHRAIVRVDFNVPLDEQGHITDDTRIRGALPTLRKILDDGGALILMSHMGKPKGKYDAKYSLAQITEAVSQALGMPVAFAPDCGKALAQAQALKAGEVLLLENLRFYAEEEGKPVGIDKEDPAYEAAKKEMKERQKAFAKTLASYADVYVMDAFGTAHRKHASTAVIADYFDADHKMHGLLMQQELAAVDNVLEHIGRPFTAIMGGSKVSTKIGIIENLLDKVDTLILCGGMTYTFSKAHGGAVGDSICEADKLDVALYVEELARQKGVRLVLATDSVCADSFSNDAATQIVPSAAIPDGWEGLDIGPASREAFAAAIEGSKTILWNGPAGVFEFDNFTAGSRALGEAVAKATAEGAFSLIGGGDTVACVHKFGLADKVSYISTGGGALLEAIEGKVLPGVAAIRG